MNDDVVEKYYEVDYSFLELEVCSKNENPSYLFHADAMTFRRKRITTMRFQFKQLDLIWQRLNLPSSTQDVAASFERGFECFLPANILSSMAVVCLRTPCVHSSVPFRRGLSWMAPVSPPRQVNKFCCCTWVVRADVGGSSSGGQSLINERKQQLFSLEHRQLFACSPIATAFARLNLLWQGCRKFYPTWMFQLLLFSLTVCIIKSIHVK